MGVDHELPKETSLCIYRVAQEALRNIAKHAAVAEAKVSLQVSSSQLLLRVEDQGIGFDMEAMRSQPGLGLSIMIERVRLIGAELTVVTSPGCGTAIEVLVAIDRNAR